MRARVRDTEIYFDIEGAGLVSDGPRMREKPPAFIIHGGPGSDHSGLKPAFAPLAGQLQLVHFDHRGQGRSARGDSEKYTLDENVE
ncbi:MAG: alpha/beta fold hydrolase, partial [Hyphomicrobiales bacterium]